MSTRQKFHDTTQFSGFSHTHEQVAKSREERQNRYEGSFGDFPEDTIYRDPLGFRAGEPVMFQKEWSRRLHEDTLDFSFTPTGSDRATIVEKWDELQKAGFSVSQTTEVIQKATGTGDFQLPLDILEDVFTVSPGQTPAAEVIPRITTNDDRVFATAETGQPEPDFDLENNVGTDSDGNAVYKYEDPSYEPLQYDVLGYGVATRFSDKLVLAGANLRPSQSVIEGSLLTGHRKVTERQLYGINSDPNGWDGFADMGVSRAAAIPEADYTSGQTLKTEIERAIDRVAEKAQDITQIAVFLPFDAHRTLRGEFEDLQRYEPAPEQDLGFTDLALEGGQVGVFRSSELPKIDEQPNGATQDFGFVVNMASVGLYQLSEPTLDPLANLGPEERVGAAQYNVLVSESGDGTTVDAEHIQRLQADTSA